MTKSVPFAALALCLIGVSTGLLPVAASTGSVVVSPSDLDLGSPKGRRTLDRRIARASASLCASGAGHLDAGVRRSERLCREATVRTGTAELATRLPAQLASR